MRLVGWMMVVLVAAAVARAAPTDSYEQVKKALAQMKAGDFEGALARLKDAQIEDPDSDQLHFDIGICLYKLERWDEAAQAFENVLFSRDRDIEIKAAFHLGNCAFRQGKLKEAIEHYNRALERRPDYDDARVNREYVTRKLKELVRKKKEQDQKRKAERQIVEKLKELVQKELELHAGTRGAMLAAGQTPPPTTVTRFEDVLDGIELPDDHEPAPRSPEEDGKLLHEIGKRQGEILEATRELIEEVRGKIDDAEQAAAAGPPAGASPGAGPAAGQAPPNPEIEKLKKAAPFLAAAEPAMVRAQEGARDELSWSTVHTGEQEALVQLIAALDELLDELTRIIQDQVQLLKDTLATKSAAEDPDEAKRPAEDALRDEAVQHGETQGKLEERTVRFAKGMEQYVQMMQQQAAGHPGATGPGQPPAPHPGQDPKEQIRRFEQALTHLNNASRSMDEAESALSEVKLDPGLDAEKAALEELVKAKAALSPPQPGQQGKDEEKKQDQEKKEEQEQQQGEQQKKDEQKSEGDEDEQEQKQDQEKKQQKMSEEQAKQMLERAKQRERDRRKDEREELRRARGRASGVRKDW